MPTCLIVEGFTFSSRNYFVDEKVLEEIEELWGENIGFSSCIVTDLLVQERS